MCTPHAGSRTASALSRPWRTVFPVWYRSSASIAPELRAADAAIIVDPTPDDIALGITAILRSPQEYSDRAIQFVRSRLAWNAIINDYLRQIERLRHGK